MNTLSKRGMLDDVFDLVFMVIVGFFAFLFVQGMLNVNADNRVEQLKTEVVNLGVKQNGLAFWQSPLSYGGQEWTVAEFILHYLSTPEFNSVTFEAALKPAIMESFPQSYRCGYLFRSKQGEEVLLRYSFSQGREGIEENIVCPTQDFTLDFAGTEKYQIYFIVGGER